MRVTALALTFAIAGCAPKIMTATIAPADLEAAAMSLQPGTATIKGSALLRQRGGGVVTCAGNEVFLIPSTESTAHEFLRIFGGDSGFVSNGGTSLGGGKFVAPPEPYRRTVCNTQGFFAFDKVQPKKWYVMTTVLWEIPNQFGSTTQGGTLLGVADPNEGAETEITLAF